PSRRATAPAHRRWSPWRRKFWTAACRRSAPTAAPACLRSPGRSWKNSLAALCDKPVVVAVGGPTATGKTALAVHLARAFGGEVISADSMQVYRGLDIGTAKATEAERQGVPHHLLDILDPAQPFSVADFVAAAGRCIDTLTAAGTLPILAGGTGLYLTSLLGGMDFTPEKPDPALRAALERRAAAEGREALYAELQRVDPAYAAAVHPNNLPRVIRALELYAATGR